MYVHRVREINGGINTGEVSNEDVNKVLMGVDKSILRKGDVIGLNEAYDLVVTSFEGFIIDLVIVLKEVI